MTPEQVFERHKPIRNKIRSFEPNSLIHLTIKTLHDRIDKVSPENWGGYLPWVLFLIIRWTFQYSEQGTRLALDKDLIEIHNAIHTLDGNIAFHDQGDRDPIAAFMGRTAFTQLQYQTPQYEMRNIGCQLVMFECFGQDFQIDSLFQIKYGLSIREFLRIYYTCWAGQPPFFSISYFSKIFSDKTIHSFFDCLSVSLEEGKHYIRDYTLAGSTVQFQCHEQSPLKLKPFFHSNGKWYAFSYKLMMSSIQDNIYDLLRRDMPDFSAQKFGHVFERYIDATVAYYSDAKYQTEKTLKSKLPKGSKLTDFLIEDDKSAIFIEAKGTELNRRAQVHQSSESILLNTKSTIVKAVTQCQEVAHNLLANGELIDKELFGLIVTYKEYYFGDGGAFWKDVIGERITANLKANGLKPVIPPENLFYISISDFDWLLAGAKQKGITISDVLLEVVKRNKNLETRAIMLRQHLESLWGVHYEPPLLKKAREAFQDEIMEDAKRHLHSDNGSRLRKHNLLGSVARI